ncbi:TolC family protein [Albibacterium profundi]|uniref:TolC family protein n=1 Tax=Albibacterium profundi TaxID=3134906 RepID=A0ABV5CAA2_9SPHI
MNIRLLAILFILTVFIMPVSGQELITLQSAIDSTLENNLQIKEARFRAALTDQDVLQSKMNLLPSLGASAGGRLSGGNYFDEKTGKVGNTTNKSVDGSLSLSVTLFQGFQRINQIRANKLLLQSDQSYVDQMEYDLVLQVFTTYIEALTHKELWSASRQQLALSEEQLRVEEINMEVGNRTLADVSQARSQVASDQLNITTSRNDYELSILNLKQLMEIDSEKEIVLESPNVEDVEALVANYSAVGVYDKALNFFPEIRMAEYNTLAAEKDVDIARGRYFPTLSLSSGLSTGYTSSYLDQNGAIFPFRQQLRDNYSRYIGLSLSIPIFNNLSSRIGVRKAKIIYENTKVAEKQSKNNLNKIVNQAVLDLNAAKQRYESSEEVFTSSRETYKVFQERYDVGLATSIELNTAQTNMNKAEFDFINSKYNLLYRTKVIDYYLGNEIRF